MIQLKIYETGGTVKKGIYGWSFTENETILVTGKVEGFQRAKGYRKLLKKVTNAVMKTPERKPAQPALPFTPEHDA